MAQPLVQQTLGASAPRGTSAIAKVFEDQARNALRGYQPRLAPQDELSEYFRRYSLVRGTDCETLLAKRQNALALLRRSGDEMMAAQKAYREEDKRSKWILVLTLTKESATAFLDLAGAMVPRLSVGTSIGSGMISAAGALSERYNKVGNGTDQALTLTEAGMAAPGVPVPGLATAQLVVHSVKAVRESREQSVGDTAAANKFFINSMADMVATMAGGGVPNGAPPTHPLSVVAAVARGVKAAYNYDLNTAKAFDDYFMDKDKRANDLMVLERGLSGLMTRQRQALSDADAALSQCMASLR